MKRKILTVGILLILTFTLISMIFGINTLLAQSSVTVTVTNVSFDVNGDTSNIDALISDPGPDGISLPEAIYATNGTQGQKLVNFDESLKGATITYSTEEDVMELSSSNITIDGDIDGDGMPDIILDGHLGQDGTPACNGLVITSSSNTITHLNFDEFIYAILITTPRDFARKTFANNKIINNTISSERGAGIWISPCGIGPLEEISLRSDIIWQGTVIQGNTIGTEKNAFRVGAAEGGGDRNQIINLTISDNYLYSNSENAIEIIESDANSAYFNLPGPIDYSDNNLIDSMTITNNVIGSSHTGISISCGNYGNSQNTVQDVKINGNTITNTVSGIGLVAGECLSNERGAHNNRIRNVEVTQNTISQTSWAITVSVANQIVGVGPHDNRVENVIIAENEIFDYTDSGIALGGGLSGADKVSGAVSGNILDLITISENNLYQTLNPGSGTGLYMLGGSGYLNGIAAKNRVQGITVLDNQISGNNRGIQIIGGDGIGSDSNQVIITEIYGNTLVGNTVSWDIRDNINGAVGNLVTGLVSQPTFNPSPGTYAKAIDVSIDCDIPSVTIRFTTDNSSPTELSQIYTSPIHIDTTTTINARAYLSNWSPSYVATATYSISNHFPVVSNTIPDTILVIGGINFTRDLNSFPAVFSDPDGDELSYTSNSSAPSVAGATISGSVLSVSTLSEGSANITVTANDDRGGQASTNFTVNIGMLNPPENLRAILQDSSIVLTWDPPSSTSFFTLENYCIYCSKQSDPFNNPLDTDTTDANTASFTHEHLTVGDEWHYAVTAIYNESRESPPCPEIKIVIVGFEEITSSIPSEFSLPQNYPNPFNPTTTISFDLPKISEVTLKIFNILGEEVATLVSDRLSAGSYSYDWNASNMASGVYLYRLEAEGFIHIKKMILMR